MRKWPVRREGTTGMKGRILAVAVLLMGSGCSDIPHDPAGTLDRVRQSGVLRVGIVSDPGPQLEEAERILLAQLARETGSQPQITPGSPETLLPKIENGDLDIVIGRFAPDSPWSARVTFLPAPEQMNAEKGEVAPAAAVRNGENAWVSLVYKHVPERRKAR